MDIYHKCPLSESKVPLFFFLLLVLPGVTMDSYGGQNIFIYLHFFAVLSSQRRKTFLFLSNSLAAITLAEKKCTN